MGAAEEAAGERLVLLSSGQCGSHRQVLWAWADQAWPQRLGPPLLQAHVTLGPEHAACGQLRGLQVSPA